jgi:hypothetical protein
MSVFEPVAHDGAAGQHICQFFDSDESRADAVAAFVAEGLRNGEHVLVVVRPIHWAAIVQRLAAARVPVEREIASGRVIVKDAMDTLRRISRNGAPDRAAFNEHVSTTVRGLTELGTLRVYGEMVDILAQRGDFDQAVALEGLWNALAQPVRFFLFCAYSAAHFVAPITHRWLREICATHGDVRRSEIDALAAWLLTAAHHPISPSSAISH